MSQFAAGDDLVFQLESGFGVVRLLAVEGGGPDSVWHLLVYSEFFATVDAAEAAVLAADSASMAGKHFALTDRAFERTPASVIGHRELTETELNLVSAWHSNPDQVVSDRSLLLMLGMR